MNLDVESLQTQIPYYLTAQDRQVLVDELKAISGGGTAAYILDDEQDSFKDEMLQGDGWRGFQILNFDNGARRSIRGVVMSNSCDVDPGNPREVPARVIFCPLVKLNVFRKVLEDSGIDKERLDQKMASIRAQKTTNMFYLPAGGPLAEEHVVKLDETHSMALEAVLHSAAREKIFTLSNTGFYMFLFKLSLHFCRFQEKINRKGTAVGT